MSQNMLGGTFTNQQETVPVGDKYTEYTTPSEQTIQRGDIVIFDDPDSENMTVFIGFVESICDMNRGGVEIFSTCAPHRLDLSSPHISIRGEYIDTTSGEGLDSQIESFISKAELNSNTRDPVEESPISGGVFEWEDSDMNVTWE